MSGSSTTAAIKLLSSSADMQTFRIRDSPHLCFSLRLRCHLGNCQYRLDLVNYCICSNNAIEAARACDKIKPHLCMCASIGVTPLIHAPAQNIGLRKVTRTPRNA